MDKTDILNLVWTPLVTDSHCLWQGNGHVTWKIGHSLECSPNIYFKPGVCSCFATWQKKTPSFSISKLHTKAPPAPPGTAGRAENPTWCFSSPSELRSWVEGLREGESSEWQAQVQVVLWWTFLTFEWDQWRIWESFVKAVTPKPPWFTDGVCLMETWVEPLETAEERQVPSPGLDLLGQWAVGGLCQT